MIARFKKKIITIVALLVVSGLVFGFAVPDLHARRCEDAYMKCLRTIGYSPVSMYCGVGWVFCKKYIE
jgi:hypothetical protein